jgi:proteasome lid subunit RPN8/RPN11
MTIEIELFRSEDYLSVERQPLIPLLREAFEPTLGPRVQQASFRLYLVAIEDSEPVAGYPVLVNLRGSHGYAYVSIIEQGRLLYRHPHTVREIIAVPLQRRLAAAYPSVPHWGFGLVGPGLESLAMVRPTPDVAGRIEIPAGGRRRRVSHIEEIPDPDPPASTLAELGAAERGGGPAGDAVAQPVAVMLRPEAHRGLAYRPYSAEVEEGGFLIGHRHADREHPGRELLEVTEVAAAESTGASLLRFTFTGESFLRLGNLIARRGRDEQILGWYHTHLFAATDTFGLSTVDVQLHLSTFRRPWQVAALVNLDDTERVLRFYRSDGSQLTEMPFWLADGSRPLGISDGQPASAEAPSPVAEP